jgi:hypothetical protein
MAIPSLGPNFGLRGFEGQNETSASRFKLENVAGCVGRPKARDIPFLGFFLEEERVCFGRCRFATFADFELLSRSFTVCERVPYSFESKIFHDTGLDIRNTVVAVCLKITHKAGRLCRSRIFSRQVIKKKAYRGQPIGLNSNIKPKKSGNSIMVSRERYGLNYHILINVYHTV